MELDAGTFAKDAFTNGGNLILPSSRVKPGSINLALDLQVGNIVANRPDLVGILTILTPLSRVPPDCTNCPDKLLIWIDSTSYAS